MEENENNPADIPEPKKILLWKKELLESYLWGSTEKVFSMCSLKLNHQSPRDVCYTWCNPCDVGYMWVHQSPRVTRESLQLFTWKKVTKDLIFLDWSRFDVIKGNVRYLPKLVPEPIHVWRKVILSWIKTHNFVFYNSNPYLSSEIINFHFCITLRRSPLFLKIKEEKPELTEQ